jgi:hypothetical protein
MEECPFFSIFMKNIRVPVWFLLLTHRKKTCLNQKNHSLWCVLNHVSLNARWFLFLSGFKKIHYIDKY